MGLCRVLLFPSSSLCQDQTGPDTAVTVQLSVEESELLHQSFLKAQGQLGAAKNPPKNSKRKKAAVCLDAFSVGQGPTALEEGRSEPLGPARQSRNTTHWRT